MCRGHGEVTDEQRTRPARARAVVGRRLVGRGTGGAAVSAEVRDVLARAAAEPRIPVDYDEIDRRARARRRRRTRLRVAGASLAAAAAVAGVAVVAAPDEPDVRPAPAVSVTGAPWIENSLPAPVRTSGARV